ncbi:MAG: DUF3095 domain-containing protein [Chitinophagaceae bacterium]|nr:DUF3095 domain-containing protein [Chitinophagaceae bacterium]
MTTSNNDLFYTRLPVNQLSLSDLLTEEHLFFKIPSSWHVLITDVKKSTVAVENGLHETVNLVATGSIVAVLNIAYKENLTIPFFFGGDGATFIVPPIILDAVMKALIKHQQNTDVNFGIMLRVGHVPVETIYAEGHSLNISKLRTSDLFSIPVLLGNGLSYAERIIKGEAYLLTPPTLTDDELDMSGMQCRWDKIKPPENYDEVVSLLVVCREQVNQAEVFKKVIDHIDKIYGNHQKRQPITVSKLKLKGTLKKIGREMQVRMGSYKPMYLLRTWFTTLLGSLYFRTKPGKRYLAQLVDMSDTLVIDGKINTVISGTQLQRKELDAALNELERDGYINYGLHVSKESVMSCYVRGMDEHHIHFIDGSDGGYTQAASVLKKKIYQH